MYDYWVVQSPEFKFVISTEIKEYPHRSWRQIAEVT